MRRLVSTEPCHYGCFYADDAADVPRASSDDSLQRELPTSPAPTHRIPQIDSGQESHHQFEHLLAEVQAKREGE